MQALQANTLNHPAIWRGNDCARIATPSIPTGFPELDAAFPGGGWPAAVLTEIYAERPGIGELRLLMPAVARLTSAGRWVALISPPHVPYAPALAAYGVNLARLIQINTPEAEKRFWACEETLRYQGCGAVLAWVNHAPERALKRLQLAAEAGNSAAVLFRSARVIPASPAALRLQVTGTREKTLVHVLKRRGSGLPTPVALDMPHSPCALPQASAPLRACLTETVQ